MPVVGSRLKCARCREDWVPHRSTAERVRLRNGPGGERLCPRHYREAWEAADETIYYATRCKGRSKGVLHSDRECPHIKDIPDEDIIDRPRWAFDPDQDHCKDCGGDA